MRMTTRLRPMILVGAAACLLAIGCHRRTMVPTLPPVVKTPDAPPPEPVLPSMSGSPPESITHAPRVKVTQTKPAKKSKKSSQKAVLSAGTTPVEVAAAPVIQPAPESVVGALTTGGEVSPKAQQETADLIASDERRLQALNGTKARDQLTQLKEIRHFLDQAKEALASGDIEGAKTLATKTKLLIDDLEQWAQKQ